ncbi:MAG: hypothetical protein NVS4B3_19760 [Gemmatimonadaceae bacterium]
MGKARPGQRALAVATIAGLGALVGCGDATGPKLPRAIGFEAPAIYRLWWQDVETCSGARGSLDEVRFYRVVAQPGEDSSSFRDPAHDRYLFGEWVPGSNAIYLAPEKVTNRQIVRHEMLHALIRVLDHPPEYFVTRCGAEVSY